MKFPRKQKKAIILLLAVTTISLTGLVFRYLHERNDHLRMQVFSILINNPQNPSLSIRLGELAQLGPGIAPYLSELAQMRESLLSKQYSTIWQKFPSSIKFKLPSPLDRSRIRFEAMSAIAYMGPAVARQCGEEVLACLWDDNPKTEGEAFKAASWLMRDSIETRQAVVERIKQHTKMPVNVSALSLDYDEIMWKHSDASELVLTNLLADPQNGYRAAIDISFMESNAIPYVPHLLDFLNQTEKISKVTTKPDREAELVAHTKAMAIKALGSIGYVDPKVADTLVQSWNNEDKWIRQNAAESIAVLGNKMSHKVTELTKDFDESDNAVLGAKLNALGSMGADASEAIPVLLQHTSSEFLREKVTAPETNVHPRSIKDLLLSAEMALCNIDSTFCPQYVLDWPDKAIGGWWKPVGFMCAVKGISNQLVKAVEPILESDLGYKKRVAAFIILHHDPNHHDAKRVLTEIKEYGNLKERLVATRFLYLATGDLEGIEELIEEGLSSSEQYVKQSAIQLAEKLETLSPGQTHLN